MIIMDRFLTKRGLFLIVPLFCMRAQIEAQRAPKILAAYFSQTGNTRGIARYIHQKTGGDLFEIERAAPYLRNEEYDFSGKTIIPFCSHGGYGRSRSAIVELVPRSTIAETLAIRTSVDPSLSDTISGWLRRNDIAEQ